MEVERSEVQDHPQLDSKFEVCLGYLRPNEGVRSLEAGLIGSYEQPKMGAGN